MRWRHRPSRPRTYFEVVVQTPGPQLYARDVESYPDPYVLRSGLSSFRLQRPRIAHRWFVGDRDPLTPAYFEVVFHLPQHVVHTDAWLETWRLPLTPTYFEVAFHLPRHLLHTRGWRPRPSHIARTSNWTAALRGT